MTILWTIWDFLTSRVGQIVAAVGAALFLIWRVYRAGQKDAEKDMELKDAKLADRVRARADKAARRAVADARGLDDNALNERLRESGRLRQD